MTEPSLIHRLDRFRPTAERGRSRIVEGAWQLTNVLFFQTSIPWPSRLKVAMLRRFGASIGRGVVIRPRVTVHMPWKLSIGDHCWIGYDVFVLNLEPISIGSHCSISHRVFLCTGNHDYKSETFDYQGAPISIEDGVWVASQTFVGPGVTLGRGSVVTAGAIVLSDQPPQMVCGGNPCRPIRTRGLE